MENVSMEWYGSKERGKILEKRLNDFFENKGISAKVKLLSKSVDDKGHESVDYTFLFQKK